MAARRRHPEATPEHRARTCRRRSLASCAWATLLIAAGCGGPDARVSGTVTLDGTALNSGYVTFSAEQPGQSGHASGSIQTGGAYSVQAGRTGGLPPGRYRVTVTAREKSAPNPSGGPPAPGKLITPAKYSKADTSGLVVEVKPGHNVIDLPLEAK